MSLHVGRGVCGVHLRFPPPLGRGKGGGAWEELGPTLPRAVTWAGTSFQTCKPQSVQSFY